MAKATQNHKIRTKDGGTRTFAYSRSLAVKLFCVECMGFEADPKGCTAPMCPLFPFRRRTQASLKGDKGTVPLKGPQKAREAILEV